jgi:hypothetical protein
MATTFDQKANFVRADVSTGYDASATSIDLASGQGTRFPDPASGAYNLVWKKKNVNEDEDPNIEVIRVTTKSSDTLGGLSRGQEGTSAATHNDVGAEYEVYLAPTKKVYTDIETAVNSIENSIPVILIKIKTADETVNNSDVYQDDDHIASISLAASTSYILEIELAIETGSPQGIKTQLVASENIGYALWGFISNSASNDFLYQNHATGTNTTATLRAGLPVTNGFQSFKGIITTTLACTLKLQWAQSTAAVSDTKLLKGSFLKLTKV